MTPRTEPQQAPPDVLWTPADVATYLRASRSWVYQKSASGELPCLRIGGMLRFDPEKIKAFARGEVTGARVIALATRR